MTNSDNKSKTKNDIAWEELFNIHPILEVVQSKGFFEITSEEINKVRESRLMAKFDHKAKLPQIFENNKLSILPISRNSYIIGNFNTHLDITYNLTLNTINVDFPEVIESIDYTNIYSESIALNCAFNAEIIAYLLDVQPSECYYTLSGRMSTGNFNFNITNIINNNFYNLSVNNSQCEIDAGFETEDTLLIIEAKNYIVEDFLIRQLYYPYRLWKNKISKKVIPALMTYSNNSFSFFIYEFTDENDYNSIKLVRQVNYQISSEEISTQDFSDLLSKVKVKPERNNIPFPQSDSFSKIIELITLLRNENLTKEEISDYYQFDIRQAQYYSNGAKYLGLVESMNESKTLTLTDEGLLILTSNFKQRTLSLIEKILEHQVFYDAFEISLDSGKIPDKEAIIKIMSFHLKLKSSTMERRSRTVKSWLEWIWSVIN